MTDAVAHPPGFRRRRGVNWTFIGLLYTSFYICRYNLSLSNQAISTEFGFSKAQMGAIITTALLAYACGLIINGLLQIASAANAQVGRFSETSDSF